MKNCEVFLPIERWNKDFKFYDRWNKDHKFYDNSKWSFNLNQITVFKNEEKAKSIYIYLYIYEML